MNKCYKDKKMILRNSEGVIKIISRKDCKNESVYNTKIVEIIKGYTKRYKSVINVSSSSSSSSPSITSSK